MKALITGAGGFIGSFLLEELVKKGYETRCLFLPQENAAHAQSLGSQIIRGNLLEPETLGEIAEGIDVVFHLAAKVTDWGPKREFEAIIVGGTKSLLEACKGIKRFVYCSSVAGLGLGKDLVGLDEDAHPVKLGIPYSDTKIDAEALVHTYCKKHQIPYTIIRPANVIGPGSPWVRDVLDALMRGPVPLINGGKDPGAFVYVANLVDGAILAAESEAAIGRTYHFRDDYDITWGEYIEILGSLVGKKPMGNISFRLAWWIGYAVEIIFYPFKVRPPVSRLAAGVMGRNLDVDNSRAKQELGWKSRVPLDVAMKEIEKWVKEVYIRKK